MLPVATVTSHDSGDRSTVVTLGTTVAGDSGDRRDSSDSGESSNDHLCYYRHPHTTTITTALITHSSDDRDSGGSDMMTVVKAGLTSRNHYKIKVRTLERLGAMTTCSCVRGP